MGKIICQRTLDLPGFLIAVALVRSESHPICFGGPQAPVQWPGVPVECGKWTDPPG
jgi:hypothetical protein